MDIDTLNNIIMELYNVGFIVVAVVSDMGTKNMKLWAQVNIGHDKECFIEHPGNNELKIFVFADVPHLLKLVRNHFVPHLLKLVRNHFLDQGFYIDGKSITKDSIQKLLEVANSELTICPKINSSHLELTGPQRQRVRPAAQLLSRTVAKALEYCGTNNMLPATNWRDTSNFILMINDWFDVHNSTSKFCGNNPTKNAFGIDLDNQEKILDNISSTMEHFGQHFLHNGTDECRET
ncbi:Transposase protein [Popillia japonica]|uniref:Transposase protein n=1 Tax=Popillia japonica TaxID=7064 RepID=A0AAW1LW03_POPJA